jgi:hypothetical protein
MAETENDKSGTAPAQSPLPGCGRTKTEIEAAAEKPARVAFNLAAVPQFLKELPQWVLWKWQRVKDRWTKVPYNPHTGRKASSTDKATWGTLDDIATAWRMRKDYYDGIGFVFVEGGGITGIDLDDCIDPATGQIKEWGARLIASINSYAELSPSLTGVKLWALASKPGAAWSKEPYADGEVEMYDRGRFFTVTGRDWPGTPATVEERQEAVTALYNEVLAAKEVKAAAKKKPAVEKRNGSGNGHAATMTFADDEVIARAGRAKNGSKFRALMDGDISGHADDESRADSALCCMLAFWTQDESQIDRIFRQSGLYREKWDERRGEESYGQRTIREALATVTEHYGDRRHARNGKGHHETGAESNGQAQPDPGAPTGPLGCPYLIQGNCVCRVKVIQGGGEIIEPLCNFSALIVEEVVHDDGSGETKAFLVLEGKMISGESLARVEVSAATFAAMGWVIESWGGGAVVYAGQGAKDHLRAAIQLLSGRRLRHVVYQHTGWREIEGDWYYLHGGGAIGPNGPVPAIHNTLPAALAEVMLPVPPEGDALRAAIRSSLAVLDLGPERVTAPMLGATYRAPLGESDFSVHAAGPSGVFKSELPALCQQHYGAGLDSRHLPGNWSSTANATEMLAFAAKDMLLVIDDFAPGGSQNDVARLHREADRVFRGAGNRSCRMRLSADGTLRAVRPPRATVMSTGEEIPRGHSIRGRLAVVEISHGELNRERLSERQQAGSRGDYAAAMSGYLKWLAPRYGELRRSLRAEQLALREEMQSCASHRRTPGILADLLLGWRHWLTFALDVGAVSQQEVSDYLERVAVGMRVLGEAQADHQQADEPAEHFLRLIRSAVTSGRAHVASMLGQEPVRPGSWGWRGQQAGSGDTSDMAWTALGRRVGWLELESDLYLDPESAHAEAQRLAADKGEALPVTARTLGKRLREKSLLKTTDQTRGKLTVRKVIEGRRQDVWHLDARGFYVSEQPAQ